MCCNIWIPIITNQSYDIIYLNKLFYVLPLIFILLEKTFLRTVVISTVTVRAGQRAGSDGFGPKSSTRPYPRVKWRHPIQPNFKPRFLRVGFVRVNGCTGRFTRVWTKHNSGLKILNSMSLQKKKKQEGKNTNKGNLTQVAPSTTSLLSLSKEQAWFQIPNHHVWVSEIKEQNSPILSEWNEREKREIRMKMEVLTRMVKN